MTQEQKHERVKEVLTPDTLKLLSLFILNDTGYYLNFELEVKRPNTPREYLYLTSQQLVEQTGIMKINFDSIVVDCCSINQFIEEGIEYISIPLHFSYSHKGGGSNGCGFMDVFYKVESKIFFKR